MSRSGRLQQGLPHWARSIRFRLTLIYSLMLFGLAAIVVGAVYWGLARNLNERTVAFEMSDQAGNPAFDIEQDIFEDRERVEILANERALETLRRFSFGALGVLFVSSLGVGWFVAGRVLAPIGRITAVARDIQATDLSRRIGLDGADDELKQLADTFDDMLRRLEHAFAGQRRLIHEASHELRNPLAVIKTNLEVTMSDPGSELDDYVHTSEVVSRSVERMTRLVDDLLAYARQETAAHVQEPVDITLLIGNLGEEFSGLAERADMRLSTISTPGLWVVGDADALQQAVSNLLANALRLSPTGSEVRLTAGEEDGWVWLAVEDEGPGVSDHDRDRIFQRYVRLHPTETGGKGSGLGLAIVRQIAESHRGEVRLVSQPDKGATFVIWIPALAVGDPALETRQILVRRPHDITHLPEPDPDRFQVDSSAGR